MVMTMSAAWTTSSVSVRVRPGGVDAGLGEDLRDERLHLRRGVRAGRRDGDPACGTVREEGGGELGAARVVAADEQHARQPAAGAAPDVSESVKAFRGEAFGQHDQVRAHLRGGGQQAVGVGEQRLDGLGGEAAGVPGGEAGDSGGQALVGQEG
jgi:hypothetical protein